MRSKWKLQPIPSFCLRKNFINLFNSKEGVTKSNQTLRVKEGNVVNIGSCKRFRIFKKMEGFVLEVYTGADTSSIFISKDMSFYYVGSFAFTKRFTGEIHKDPVQRRQKRSFNKTKKK